jgi:hypothetical protein
MRRWIVSFLFVLMTCFGAAQTVRNFPSLETDNAFQGANSFGHINSSFYVSQASGVFPSIQSAVTQACTTGGARVMISAGSTPTDTIGGVTGGCSTVAIVDQRALPDACYSWSGSAYTVGVCASGGGGGATPAGVANDLQIHSVSGSTLAADSGNLQNNSTTHNLFQKQLNNIPYASQFLTGGGGNGISNAFSATGAATVINNSGNPGDLTFFGPSHTGILDQQMSSYGTRVHDCVFGTFIIPTFSVDHVCISDFYLEDHPVNPNGTGGFPFKAIMAISGGYGLNMGNPSGLQFPDEGGWGGLNGLLHLQMDSYRSGLDTMMDFGGLKLSNGDFRDISLRYECYGGNTDSSAEGCNGMQIQQLPEGGESFGTIAATSGVGDRFPVLTKADHNFITGGSFLMNLNPAHIITTTYTAQSVATADAPDITLLAVAGGLTPSTARGITVSYIPEVATTGVYQVEHGLTATIGAGTFVNGKVWLTGPSPEEGTISNLSVSGGTVTYDLSHMFWHPVGSFMVQGGTNGCLSFDGNTTATGRYLPLFLFGSKDSTHAYVGYLSHGSLNVLVPQTEVDYASPISPFNGVTIAPCTQILAITDNSNDSAVALTQNDVTWTVGDSWVDAWMPATNSTGLHIDMSLVRPSNSSESAGILLTFQGVGASSEFQPFRMINETDPSLYTANGGQIGQPIAVSIQGNPTISTSSYSVDLLVDRAPSHAFLQLDNAAHVSYDLMLLGSTAGVVSMAFDGTTGALTYGAGFTANGFHSTSDGVIDGNLLAGQSLTVGDGNNGPGLSGIVVQSNPVSTGCSVGSGLQLKLNGVTNVWGGINWDWGFANPYISEMCFSLDSSPSVWPLIIGEGPSLGQYTTTVTGLLSVNGTFSVSGTPYVSTGTTGNTDIAGNMVLTGGTDVYTFATSHTGAPNCTVTDNAHAMTYTVSTTTISMVGTAADVATWTCWGTTP